MKLNIKYAIRDRVLETYISDPKPDKKRLMKTIETIASTPNLLEVKLLESNI